MTRVVRGPDLPAADAGGSAPPRMTFRAAGAVLLAFVAIAVMVRLGFWQWDKGERTGRLLNYLYGVQWWVFAVLTVVGLIRLSLDGRRMAAEPMPESRPGGPMIGPPLRPGEELPEITWVRLMRRLGLQRRT